MPSEQFDSEAKRQEQAEVEHIWDSIREAERLRQEPPSARHPGGWALIWIGVTIATVIFIHRNSSVSGFALVALTFSAFLAGGKLCDYGYALEARRLNGEFDGEM